MAAPRKQYNVTSKDATTSDNDKNAQFCNRIGCNGRIKYNSSQNTKIESSDKAKCSKPSCSSNRNVMIGSSSRSSSLVIREKSSSLDSKTKLSSRSKFDHRSESSQSGDSQAPKLMSSSIRTQIRHQLRSLNMSGDSTNARIGSFSVPSNTRPRKMFQHKSEPKNKISPEASSVSSVSKSSSLGTHNSCSSSKSVSSTKNVMMKASRKGENNLHRKGKQTTASSSSVNGDDRNGAVSVRTQRSMDENSNMTMLSDEQNVRNDSSFQETPVNSQQSSANGWSSNSSDDDDQLFMMPRPSTQTDLNDHLARLQQLNRDLNEANLAYIAFHRLSLDEELTPEEIIALETSTFLDNPNLHDQHRDMRLDIDNMSYEELLALEESIGTVSTALPEETLLECVERSIYQTTPSDEADIKCSICQEEYVAEDETGKLIECQHGFHLACINEWLKMKNWCPICKAAVASSQ